jgi:phosphohistidine phosphatase SixA
VAAAAAAGLLLAATAAGCDGDRPEPVAPTASAAPSTATTQPRDVELVASLRRGGHVIYVRHAATEATQDDPMPDLADRRTQRNLSAAGREQARQLGLALRRLGIPVGAVLVSPYARTRETGELAFGPDRVRATRELLNEAYPGTDDEALARALRRLLARRPPAGQNTVLVSHGFNLNGATGLSIQEGESAIFLPDSAGGARLVATVTVERWQALARSG